MISQGVFPGAHSQSSYYPQKGIQGLQNKLSFTTSLAKSKL